MPDLLQFQHVRTGEDNRAAQFLKATIQEHKASLVFHHGIVVSLVLVSLDFEVFAGTYDETAGDEV